MTGAINRGSALIARIRKRFDPALRVIRLVRTIRVIRADPWQKLLSSENETMSKPEEALAILKLYELRRDEQMRAARQWYFSEFAPTSAMDIVALYRGGERASANFRMVASYWDTACSLA